MSKTIRLEDDVYQALHEFLAKDEKWSDGVLRLLRIAQGMSNIMQRAHLTQPAAPAAEKPEGGDNGNI